MAKKKETVTVDELVKKAIVPKEEEPYKIPDNWVWTRLGEVCDIVTGNTPSKKNLEYWENKDINFVKPGDLDISRDLYDSEEKIDNRAFHKIRLVPKFSTLLCCIGSLGKSSFAMVDVATNQQINSLVPKTGLFPLYNFYFTKTLYLKYQMIENSSATTVTILNKSATEKLLFPLPPLEEQKRIVKKVESMLDKISQVREIIKETREKAILRKESLLNKAFTGELTAKWRESNRNLTNVNDILKRIEDEKNELIKTKKIKKIKKIDPIIENDILFEIPTTWKRVKLNEIAFVTKLAGFEYTKNIFPNLVEKGIPLFKGKNIQDGEIVYEFESYIPEKVSDELLRSQVNKKCLLTPYVGTIGNIALFEGNFKAHLGSNVGKIEVFNNFNKNILEKYLLYYFRSSYGLFQLKKHTKATAQESISIGAIRDCVIVIPPLEEQMEIVKILDKVMEQEKEVDRLSDMENSLELLEKSILDRAFRGELGTNIPKEESAVEILRKIKEEQI